MKLGYVPLVLIPVPAVKVTVWSGAVFVIVKFPLEVIGLPEMLIPVPAVAPTLSTVPTLKVLLALKSLVAPFIVIVLELGTYPPKLVANLDFETKPPADEVSAVHVLATLPSKLLPTKPYPELKLNGVIEEPPKG